MAVSGRLDARSYVAHLRTVGALSDRPWPRVLVVALGAPSRGPRRRGETTPFGRLTRMRNPGAGVLETSVVGSAAMAVVVEAAAELGVERMLLVGRAGALGSRLAGAEIVVVEACECDDGTSRAYGASGRLPVAPELVGALRRTDRSTAVTVTVDAPFLIDDRRLAELRRRRVDLVEMELAGAVAAGRRHDLTVGGLMVVSDHRDEGTWVPCAPGEVAAALSRALDEATSSALELAGVEG